MLKTQTGAVSSSPFPSIQAEMVDRLSKEADQLSMKPEIVDWKEIHRQAALARKK